MQGHLNVSHRPTDRMGTEMQASMIGRLRQKAPGVAFPLIPCQNTARLIAVGWSSATPARRAMMRESAWTSCGNQLQTFRSDELAPMSSVTATQFDAATDRQ